MGGRSLSLSLSLLGDMEYSGPAGSLADVEADLALSDDEDDSDKHWPPMALHTQHSGPIPWQPLAEAPNPHPVTQRRFGGFLTSPAGLDRELAEVKMFAVTFRFDSRMQLYIISWNACGIRNYSRLASLKTYIGHYHPHIIFIQVT